MAEDPDNHDYIYSIPAWAACGTAPRGRTGSASGGASPAGIHLSPLDLGARADQAAIIDLFSRWAAQKSDCGPAAHEAEFVALRRVFALAADERLGAFGIEDGETLVAFSVWEELPGGIYCQAHFRKADRSYEGLAAYLQHEESRLLADRGYRLMNVEQDLGIPGLRAHKSSLRPCGFLRKYTIAVQPPTTDGERIIDAPQP